MSLAEHARRELTHAGWFKPEGMYGGMVGDAVMELINLFVKQGHSGMSASIVLGLFSGLADYKPIGPLTGADDEWNEVGDEDGQKLYQNNRCGRVFKRGDFAYDIEGKVFKEKSGACYTNKESRVAVTFPYAPKTEIVMVDR